jgi:type VI secretion system protein VasG
MEDAEGRFIDFKNTLILLTSNTSQDVIINMCRDPELMPSADALEKALRDPLMKVFPDALLNRLVVVPYFPISAEIMRLIISLNLRRVAKRIQENHGVPFTYDDSVLELIAKRCSQLERGARMVESLITNTILPEIGREILSRISQENPVRKVHVGVKDDNFLYQFSGLKQPVFRVV